MKQYWYVSVGQSMCSARYIGKTFATLAEVQKHLGSWITIQGNHVLVFSRNAVAQATGE
jgi:hypothetical protein